MPIYLKPRSNKVPSHLAPHYSSIIKYMWTLNSKGAHWNCFHPLICDLKFNLEDIGGPVCTYCEYYGARWNRSDG